VEHAANHRLDRFDLPWGLLAACLVLAVVASTAAAWWPARSMARMPVVAALARRPRPPLPVRRSLASAVVLAAAGLAAISLSDPLGDVQPLVLVAGTTAVIVGVVLLAPGAIRAVAAAAGRLPLAPRLALRDLVRYQARAASALGAIALGLGVALGVVLLAKANEPRADEGNLSDHQLLLRVDTFDADELGPGLADAAAAAAEAVGEHDLVELAHAVNPAGTARPTPFVEVVFPLGDDGFRGVDLPYVATPELLAHLGIDPDEIEPGTELLADTDRDDIQLLDPSERPADPTGGPAVDPATLQHLELSPYDAAPQSLITEAAMAEHGWVAEPAGWLLEASDPITDDELAAVRDLAGPAGLDVEARADQDTLTAVRRAATVVGLVLALAIVAMAISLLRGESAQDVRTLTATGARPRTRRALTATTAATLAGLGVVLSLLGAYGAVVAAYSEDLARLAPAPAGDLLTIAIGLPLAAAAAGWLLAGREPATFTRQALD
jgi:putative ABC transport system permease protein